jgi:sugar lactone lactonase YvrE
MNKKNLSDLSKEIDLQSHTAQALDFSMTRRRALAAGSISLLNLASCGGGGDNGDTTPLQGSVQVSTDLNFGTTFNYLIDVVVDSNNYKYISWMYRNIIRRSDGWYIGNGFGYVNGSKSIAKVGQPAFLALDASGENLYFSDYYYCNIRRISLAEENTPVSAHAGVPNAAGGFLNGPSTTAKFNKPLGVVIDAGGTVYVADSGNHAIRAISPSGVVTTLAGLPGTAGFADGAGTSALFNGPHAIAVDANGYVYVTESIGHRIRKISPTGIVTTLAGTGTVGSADGNALEATFNAPRGIAVDLNGYVYISDTGNNIIRVLSPSGIVTTIAGKKTAGAADGDALSASFNAPRGISLDNSGNIYVADYNNNRIRKISFVKSS